VDAKKFIKGERMVLDGSAARSNAVAPGREGEKSLSRQRRSNRAWFKKPISKLQPRLRSFRRFERT